MSDATALPQIEEAYNRLFGVLFRALGRLAAQGFVADPVDGRDLIHEFFAEAWPRLIECFQPELGTFDGYAYSAFVQFARGRIVKLNRLRRQVVDPAFLDSLRSPAPGPDEHMERGRQTPVLERAVAELPADLRRILKAYCYAGQSEREIAREFTLTRYKLRERLVEALGRVVVSLPRPDSFSRSDWDVAVEVWGHGRNLHQAAQALRLTEHQAHIAYRNCTRAVSSIIRNYRQPRRSSAMKPVEMQQNSLDLLRAALTSPGNEGLLEQVQARADEILRSLERDEAAFHPIANAGEDLTDHAWVSRVYQALAGPMSGSVDEDRYRDLFHAAVEDRRSIGRAFEQVLLEALRPELKRFPEFFSRASLVEESGQTMFREQADVVESPSSEGLTRYGVTPVTILTACDAVAQLAERMIDRGFFAADVPLLLSVEDAEQPADLGLGPDGALKAQQFKFQLALSEVKLTTECTEATAHAILRWCIAAAQDIPGLFDGFVSEMGTHFGVIMTYTGESIPDLYQRWQPAPLPVGATSRGVVHR